MLCRHLSLLASAGPLAATGAAGTPSTAVSHAPAILMSKEATGWTSGNWSGYAESSGPAGSTWEIELEDTTTGRSLSADRTHTEVADTVEWIVEAPTVGGSQSTLATYSTMYFDKDAFNGFYAAFTTANRGVMIQGGKHVSTPSKPDSDKDGFAVAHGAKPPPPPAS